jgi:hypothetical protein
MTIKIFLEWEFVLFQKYLKRDVGLLLMAGPAIKVLIDQGYKLTVNQVRLAFIATDPHPDERGELLITAPDDSRQGDVGEPPLAVLQACRAFLEMNNANHSLLAQQYPELYQATNV